MPRQKGIIDILSLAPKLRVEYISRLPCGLQYLNIYECLEVENDDICDNKYTKNMYNSTYVGSFNKYAAKTR